MLQTSVPYVLSVFSDVNCKCVYLNVAYASHICLQMFHLDVAHDCNGFEVFCKCFIRMLQVFHLNVVKVDQVLHMLQCA